MACRSSITRMVSAARLVSRPGILYGATRTSPALQCLTARPEEVLGLQTLSLSPAEAKLSAAYLQSLCALKGSLLPVQEYRLPALVKEVNITEPVWGGGTGLDLGLPSLLHIYDKVEPATQLPKQEAPAGQVTVEKQAARLIVIRRKKMKKHKLKKLRKKMKFVWLKIRQKKEYKKEKLFQAQEMVRVRAFEAFDPATYVADILRKTKEKPTPRFYRGKRLPQFIIGDVMEADKLKKEKKITVQKRCVEQKKKYQGAPNSFLT